MLPKILKTTIAEYAEAIWDGTNNSGWDAVSDRVIVLTDQVQEKTSGGVELPDDVVERQQLAVETGIIVAVGPAAFTWTAQQRRWEGHTPQVGDRVMMERYAGTVLIGPDGLAYRVIDDRCIGAVQTVPLKPTAEVIEMSEQDRRDPVHALIGR